MRNFFVLFAHFLLLLLQLAHCTTSLTLVSLSLSLLKKAPSDKRIQLDFYGFEFAPRNNNQTGDSTANKCQSESVEIRLNDRFKGTFYCGRDIKDGTKLSSNGSQVIIIVNADDRMVGSGLRVWVSFERSDSVVGLKQKTNRQPEKVPFNPLAVPVNIFSTILNMIAQRLRVLSEG